MADVFAKTRFAHLVLQQENNCGMAFQFPQNFLESSGLFPTGT